MSVLLHNPGTVAVELIELGITLRPSETRDVSRRIGGLLATATNLRALVITNTVRVVRSATPLTFWSATDGVRRLSLEDILNNFNATRAPNLNDDESAGYSFGSLWRWGNRVFQNIRTDIGGAVWQELVPSISAGIALNRYYGPMILGETNGTGQSIAVDTLFVLPFQFPAGSFFNRIGFETTSGASSTSNARLASYTSTNGMPAVRQAVFGTTPLQNPGQREIAINFTASGEVFWVALHQSQTVSLRCIRNGLVNTVDIGSATPTFGASQSLFTAGPYASGMPATFPVSLSNNTNPPPYIWFRRVP